MSAQEEIEAPPPSALSIETKVKEAKAPIEEIPTRGVKVYPWSLRVWHWVTALCIATLAVTGYLVGSPPQAIGGEASDHFAFGTIRFIHFAAGWAFGIGMIYRAVLALRGGPLLREIFAPRVDKGWFRADIVAEMKWYAFLRDEPHPQVGHNALAQLVMFLLFTLPSFTMVVTGFALYSEGEGQGSWADKIFGWVGPAVGGSQQLHTLHHVTMWAILCFVIVHVYSVIREEIMGGQSTLSVIVSGYRYWRGEEKLRRGGGGK